MDTMIQDLRYGFRRLLSNPGLTAIAVVSLALGIGANTSIFSAIDTLLLRPLPYQDADRLATVWQTVEGRCDRCSNTLPDVADLRREPGVFEDIAGYRAADWNLTGGDRPERLIGVLANASLFEVLGATPLLGRTFDAEEDRPGAGERVVVLSHGLWQRRFGGDPGIVGESIRLSGIPHTVVGVMRPGFHFPDPAVDLWTPLRRDESNWNRFSGGLLAIGRLQPGVTVVRAQRAADGLARRLAELYPESNADRGFRVLSLAETTYGADQRLILYVLFGAVGLVLLIACINVANLLLARAVGREKEIAVRAAIGAARGRMIRQLLTESVVLSLAGGALGVLFAAWGNSALPGVLADFERVDQIAINGRVLLFTLGVSVLTGLLFGLVPALRATRAELTSVLRDGGRGGSVGARRGRALRALVIAEVALALVLLASAGLVIRSLNGMLAVDPGFDAERLLTVRFSLGTEYDREGIARFQSELTRRLAEVPGVDGAGVVLGLPLAGDVNFDDFLIEGRVAPENRPFNTGSIYVGPGYFEAMGIPLARGRTFEERDGWDAPWVAVVNRSMAEKFWPGEDPVGKRVAFNWDTDEEGETRWRTVVGVVADTRYVAPGAEPRPEMYIPFAQTCWNLRQATLVVRAAGGDPASLAAPVQEQIWAVNPDVPVFDVQTMRSRVRNHWAVAPLRAAAALLGLFGAVALILASVGLYGVISYSVVQRTQEIGIRSALGAGRGSVLRLVVGQGMRTVGLGLALGLLGAVALTRLLEGLLFGVSATDPATLAAVATLLALVALVATAIPARRATRVDPMVALRAE